MAKTLKTDGLRRTAFTLWVQRVEVIEDPETGERSERTTEKDFVAYSRRLTPANRDVLRPVFEEMLERRRLCREEFPIYSEYLMLPTVEEKAAHREKHGWRLDDQARMWKEADDDLDIVETLEYARVIIDPEHVLTPEQALLIESEIDSEFWQNQDVQALRKSVDSFRSFFSIQRVPSGGNS